MILKIRNSFLGKTMSIFMVFVMGITLFQPVSSYALTGGPAQPEFNAFTPIGTSDMVDLSSGDFSYNIPLLDIGGFPINLAYNSGVNMDQEASWVGLGWDLSIGQINRQMRGLPDDFEGDEMVYENHMRPNVTIGANIGFTNNIAGVELPTLSDDDPLTLTFGLAGKYNTYDGFSLAPSAGITYDISNQVSAGLSVQSDENGLTLEPNVSLTSKSKTINGRDQRLGTSVGLTFNSRQGLSKVNLSASHKSKFMTKGLKKNFTAKASSSIGSSISFVDNTYTPQVDGNVRSENITFNAALGTEFIAAESQGQIGAYKTVQYIPTENQHREEAAYGYDNTHLATPWDVKDLNREKDGNFSVNSNNLAITNYTYDLYSINGQGVAGMFRPYRSHIGYVNDNQTNSFDVGESFGGEFGMGNAVHGGFDYESTVTESRAGLWSDNNDALTYFQPSAGADPDYEEVYYKNVGDLGEDEEIGMYGTPLTKLGGHTPITLSIAAGDKFDRHVRPEYYLKRRTSPNSYYVGDLTTNTDVKRTERVKRNQSIQKIRVEEATVDGGNMLGFVPNPDAEPHHTAGFIITRNDGARYIYGDALYNLTKKEVTFAAEGLNSDCSTGLVEYNPGDNTLNTTRGDQYYNSTTTPAYAHTYLLTVLLSADYSDVDGNGPSDNDLGSYTKFTYTTPKTYNWRIPFQENRANFNEGIKTDPRDDKGSYLYGEKKTKYISEIETKTHIAIFETSARHDGLGVTNENGGFGSGTMEQLDKISLYSKAEYFDPITGLPVADPVPIKEVHFEYSYELCPNVPNNDGAFYDGNGDGIDDNINEGKLTLKRVYFTYRNSKMGKHSDYEFSYDGLNPSYNLKGYDMWGSYKENPASGCNHNDPITVPEFNYVEQYDGLTDANTSAWSLTKIELPSGGKIQIDYESDDYQYVQNKKAMQMFKVVGAGSEKIPIVGNVDDDVLYKTTANGDAEYLYIKLPDEDAGITYTEFRIKYLSEIITPPHQENLVYFRFMVNTTKPGGTGSPGAIPPPDADFDYVTGYFELDDDDDDPLNNGDLFFIGSDRYASIKMNLVGEETGTIGDINPIARAGMNFGRKYLPRFIYGQPENNSTLDPNPIVEAIIQAKDNLLEIFQGPNGVLRNKKISRRFIPEKSWIRLGNPNGHKKGGGCRVKQIEMHDNWGTMTQNEPGGYNADRDQYYGQEYEYNLEDGTSSGVATYEPVGTKENPFVQPVFVNLERLLAPDEENYIEKPFGESFFPSPQVTYSRVSVKNLERIDLANNRIVRKHATGHVVTEFYTSKDYPTRVDQTELIMHEDKNSFLAGLLNLNARKHFTLSQGYLVHLNDMNGKMKSQRVYAEGQEDLISGVDYNYDGFTPPSNLISTDLISGNEGNLNNSVWTLSPNGELETGTIGVEYDIINDFREKKTLTDVTGVNTNLATFLVALFPGFIPMPLPDNAQHEDQLRMTTTTKIINTYGIQRETIAYDAGASVKTRNLVWDSETGEVLVTETVNEYNDKYYTLNFPAHWHYDGMGMAYKNSGIEFTIAQTGPVYTSATAAAHLKEGDEIIFTTMSNPNDYQKGWIYDISGNDFTVFGSATIGVTDIDRIKVIRSGRRNQQATSMANVVMMENPVELINAAGGTIPTDFLESPNWQAYRIINAGAVEYSEDWDPVCECGVDGLNPYVYNKKGVWRAKESHLHLAKRKQTNKRAAGDSKIDPRNDGFYQTFTPFYQFNGTDWVIHPSAATYWTSTSEVSLFSPYGFEIENKDALNRYSAAQYGYNYKFPMAVSANSEYSQMGYDGFEDYGFAGCADNEHFGFRGVDGLEVSNTESHTGHYSLLVQPTESVSRAYGNESLECGEPLPCSSFIPEGMKYWVSAWVKVEHPSQVKTYSGTGTTNDPHVSIVVITPGGVPSAIDLYPTGHIIDGWQRVAGIVDVPETVCSFSVELNADQTYETYFDDIRMHPFNGSMKSYVYNAETFWLMAELDDNNYATFYEYDKEGGLVRIKKETEKGVVTIQETRSNSVKQ